MKNIHLIESKEKSTLLYNPRHKSFCIRKEPDGMWINDGKVSGADFWSVEKAMNNGFYPYNIYIISDEEIKEGDWYLTFTNNEVMGQPRKCEDTNWNFFHCKKIVLTTDQDLIKDGVQAIDDEFLEWFVKNPSCERVEVELFPKFSNNLYGIIIPQEEPKQEWNPTQGEEVWIKVFSNWSKGIYIGYDVTKETHIVREDDEGGGHLMSSSQVLPYCEMPNKPKQETLEEAAKDWYNKEGLMKPSKVEIRAWVKGAKWQQERMYSEEEVKRILMKTGNYTKISLDVWFEQFKKK